MKHAIPLLLCFSACTDSGSDSKQTTTFGSNPEVDAESSDTSPPMALQSDVIRSLTDAIALVHFQDFQSRAEGLAEKATTFCSDPTQDGLDAVRTEWWSTRTPWKHAELIQFGPMVEYPERLGPKIDDWPANTMEIEKKIESDDPLEAEAFKSMGSATRGLPVIEYLLWGAGEESLEQFLSVNRRCEMLVGASQDVYSNAGLLLKSWQEDWRDQLLGQAEGDGLVFKDEKEVIDQWVNRIIFTVENIRETKLGKPKGDKSSGSPQPDLLESRPSGRSLQDALDVLSGVQHAWSGDLNGKHLSIKDLVVDDAALVSTVDNLFAVSLTRLADVPETLEDTIYTQPEIIDRAQTALIELQRVLQSDVAANIGITIRFNDNDGD